ncbi:MAG: phosphatase PAP2 family protein [Herpetosiphonaceae bacterium]|nr:phosphatase PAP2 family protein [Herpetosiphonaceae bacterium]
MIHKKTNQPVSPPVQSAPDLAQTSAVAGGTLVAGLLTAAAALALFALIAFSLGRGFFVAVDKLALAGAYDLRQANPWLSPAMLLATQSGSVAGLTLQTLLGAGLLLWRRPLHWRSSLLLLLVVIVGVGLLNVLLKGGFARTRPSIYPSPLHLQSYSFPSGHAMSAAAFYGCVALILVRSTARRSRHLLLVTVAALMTVLIGTSRMYFSVHYPTDVLGGFSAGLGWLVAVRLLWSGSIWRRTGRTMAAPPE